MCSRKIVPSLRFRGFGEPWEEMELEEIADKAVDNRGKTPPVSKNGTHPLIEVGCLGNGTPDYSKVEKFLDDNAFNKYLRNYIKNGDILFSTVGSIGLVSLMDNNENAAIAQNIIAFRARENYDSCFLYSMFSTEENQNKAMRIVMGAVQPSIKVSQLIHIQYFVARNIHEQKLLGQYFLVLDRLITLEQRKYDKLNTVKKSMLEKMFPQKGAKVPEIRFKGFSEPWEEKKLGEIINICSGRDYKHLSEGNIPVYGTGGYMLSVSEALSYDQDAIGIGRKGTIDKPYILKAPFWTVDTLFYALPKENIDLNFVFDIFQNIEWKKKDESTGVPSLSKTAINDINVYISRYTEQKVIGQYFSNLDRLITLQSSKIEKLRNLKKACLEKMFV